MTNLSQREAFGRALLMYGYQNKKVVVLDADTSSSTMSKYFADEFPDRFINVGIAEPCMVDVAVGLALAGFIPVINGFAALLSLRAVEQIRTCVAYAETNVKIIAGYSGVSDFKDGPTHHSIMDMGIMRMMPNMTVIAPADEVEIRKWLPIIAEYRGPVYFRLSREGSDIIHSNDSNFEIGKGIILEQGSDVCIITNGTILTRNLQAADVLKQEGISATVVEMSCIKPLDGDLLLAMADKHRAFVTVEEHSIYGGLGGAVSEFLSSTIPIPLLRMGIRDCFSRTALNYSDLLDFSGLGVGDIVKTCKKAIEMKTLNRDFHLV